MGFREPRGLGFGEGLGFGVLGSGLQLSSGFGAKPRFREGLGFRALGFRILGELRVQAGLKLTDKGVGK